MRIPATLTPIDIEPFQERGWTALCGPETHVLLYGGARSGKTQLVVLWLVLRALGKPSATHAVLRHHFSHLKASIIYDTLPDVCERTWPGQRLYTLNKSDWYAEFVGGGRIYFGGLDDKERTEKILGQGHSSIYLNEASQISYASRLKAVTRLSQSRGLRLKEVCDENPPITGHWTQRLWLKGVDPSTGAAVPNPKDYAVQRMNPADNPHIPEATKNILRALPPRERSRFWDGEFGQGTESALWTYESIEAARVDRIPEGVSLAQSVVAIDPSGCHGPEDKRSDEVGIVAGGLGDDGIVYVLEDASGRYGPGGKDGWGERGAACYRRWKADRVVGEINFGGAMVGAVMQSADVNVPFREVTASRGKAQRAEPIATLTDRGKVKFVGHFPELEQQLLSFSTAGYMGARSPDRADAFVWMAYALGVVRMSGQGVIEYYQRQADALPTASAPSAQLDGASLISLACPPRLAGSSTFSSASGTIYQISDGRVFAQPDEVAELQSLGFTPTP